MDKISQNIAKTICLIVYKNNFYELNKIGSGDNITVVKNKTFGGYLQSKIIDWSKI
jgi:hypothetical protein